MTDYRVLKQFADYALVELHHSHGPHPPDPRAHGAHRPSGARRRAYGGPHTRAENISVARPMLHAYKLGFTHPRTQQFMEFTAPVPEDMLVLCEN